ncbi:MAG: PGF-pre-PGF domain-containing protein, partial [Haloquadratum sp.]
GGGGGLAPIATSTPTPTPTPTPTRSRVRATDGGAVLIVENGRAGRTVTADFGDAVRSEIAAVTQLRVRPGADVAGFRVTVTPPTPATTAPELTDAAAVAYFRADAVGLSTARIANASIRVSVPASSLPAGAAPGRVRLYRHHDGAWRRLETTYLGGGVYEARTPGFSAFAIGVVADSTAGATATTDGTATVDGTVSGGGASPTAATSGPSEATPTGAATPSAAATSTPAPATDGATPGFGIVAAVVAVAAVAFGALRRAERGDSE